MALRHSSLSAHLSRRRLLLACLTLPACRFAPSSSPTAPSTTPTPASPLPPSPTPTSTIVTSPTPTSPSPTPGASTPTEVPGNPVAFTVTTLVTGLQAPWEIAFTPDGRVFLTERPGRVRLVTDGKLEPEPLLTLDVAAVGEAGLLGLALYPDFNRQPWIFLYYTYAEGQSLWNRVVRYTLLGNRLTDPSIILDRIPGASIHDGGRITFGPDGRLFVTTGDARNPLAAQDLSSLAGKILRLEPDGSIPTDNPFPESPIWSYGHRNPQGIAWTPDGRLYATEHGPTGDLGLAAHDEVNLIEPGSNYGWPYVVGNLVRQPLPEAVPPVLESGTTTWAPSGATIVQKGRIPQWQGNLLFAGLRSQALWRVVLAPDGRSAIHHEALYQGEYGRLRTVVEGPDGALYLLTSNRDGRGRPQRDDDRILRIAPTT